MLRKNVVGKLSIVCALLMLLLLSACTVMITPEAGTGDATPAPQEESSDASDELVGPTWQWVQTEYGDGTLLVPSDPTRYTLTFNDDGTVVAQLDCNTGSGTYAVDGATITFGPMATTAMACLGDSQADQFGVDLSNVNSHVFQDGHLFLAIKLDSGIMEFAPVEVGEEATPEATEEATEEPTEEAAEEPSDEASDMSGELVGTTWQWVQTQYGDDFAGLWAHYTTSAVEALMASIEEGAGATKPNHKIRADLYEIIGYDPTSEHFDAQSPVVTAPLPTLYTLAAGVLYRHGWGWLDAELQVQRTFVAVMNAPLPREMVRATTHLPTLFGALRGAGVQIAVITSDDRAPTVAALTWLNVLDEVAFIACADDDYPFKPAPEAVWAACEATSVPLSHTVMVGDSTTDMLMGQRAGVGLRVAVLTGMMEMPVLAPLADIVMDSIGEIRVQNPKG